MSKPRKSVSEDKRKAEEYLAGWQRAQADLENLKKRTAAEKEEYRKYCLEDVVLQLLPVLDHFKLAFDHVPADQKDSNWIIGISHIQKQLTDVLASLGVEEVKVEVGDDFNPTIQEAVESVESSEVKPGHVVRVVSSAYRMHDKIIRHARVVVAK